MDNKDQENSDDIQKYNSLNNRDIPLWLQGLEEPIKENNDDESSPHEASSTWVQEEKTIDIPHQAEAPPPSETNHIPQPDDEGPFEEMPLDENIIEEGFIEISELNLDSAPARQPDENLIPDEEELPSWLHEMIEEEPNLPEEEYLVSIPSPIDEVIDEPTEPVDITQETILNIYDEPVIETEISMDSLEEIFENEPALSKPEDEPSEDIQDEGDDEISTQEPPRMLTFAKYLLDEGETTRAIEIFTSFMEQPGCRENIKIWLNEAVNDSQHSEDSEIWESLGDIAMQEGDSERALCAYTKAFNILISLKKEDHETH